MNFKSSSQRHRWTFSRDQLVNFSPPFSASDPSSQAEKRTEARISALHGQNNARQEAPLAVEDEQELLRYYERSIVAFCQRQSYSSSVRATALIYLKRFYLQQSVMNQDPSKLFIACIYVAAKVEEEYLSIEALVPLLPNLTESALRKSELRLLKALNYDLIVHTPFRYIDGLIEDLSKYMKDGEFDKTGLRSFEELSTVRRSAYVAAQCLLETDAPLLYTPDKLALAAVRSGFKSNGKRLDAYLSHVIHPLLHTNGATLRQELSEIDQLGVEGSQRETRETEYVQTLDRRLKKWLKGNQQQKSKTAKTEEAVTHTS